MKILGEIAECRVCVGCLPHAPRPVLAAGAGARVMIVGQAPGRRVHETGVPWNDPSGDRLRSWLGVDAATFYDTTRFALVPMGFCYPGKGRSGDLPPRPECAPLWHPRVIAGMPEVRLTLLVGRYSQAHYLGDRCGADLTETVRRFEEFLPRYFPLPHPSPRNRLWLRNRPWFESDVLPVLRRVVAASLGE